ncbi:hypothetical protein HYU11_03375 [Candidatus Woesearchaeota archaeon]|nr:hypothetical protein [Candidatus Woesearchaeota archaeon]
MIEKFAIMLVVMLLSIQAVYSQNANISDEIRSRQTRDSVDDFLFGARVFFSFDETSKLKLLSERNTQLRERSRFLSSNVLKADETDSDLFRTVNEKRNKILREQFRRTLELRKIQAKAMSEARTDIERMAASVAMEFEKPMFEDLDFVPKTDDLMINESTARGIAESQLGLTNANITSRDSSSDFIVESVEVQPQGDFRVVRNVKAKVQAETGAVSSVDITTRVVSANAAASEIAADVSGEQLSCENLQVIAFAHATAISNAAQLAQAEARAAAFASTEQEAIAAADAAATASATASNLLSEIKNMQNMDQTMQNSVIARAVAEAESEAAIASRAAAEARSSVETRSSDSSNASASLVAFAHADAVARASEIAMAEARASAFASSTSQVNAAARASATASALASSITSNLQNIEASAFASAEARAISEVISNAESNARSAAQASASAQARARIIIPDNRTQNMTNATVNLTNVTNQTTGNLTNVSNVSQNVSNQNLSNVSHNVLNQDLSNLTDLNTNLTENTTNISENLTSDNLTDVSGSDNLTDMSDNLSDSVGVSDNLTGLET